MPARPPTRTRSTRSRRRWGPTGRRGPARSGRRRAATRRRSPARSHPSRPRRRSRRPIRRRADGAGRSPGRRPARARPRRPVRPDRPGLSPMGRVAVVFTGGTISTAFDPVAGGNVPVLDGAAILARTPGLDAIADVVPIDRGRTPASHFTFPDAARDRRRRALGAGGSGDRRRGRRPGHRHDRGDRASAGTSCSTARSRSS